MTGLAAGVLARDVKNAERRAGQRMACSVPDEQHMIA